MANLILSGDIELRTSERLTDAEDGGGEMSGNVVVDGVVHQVFGPVSESDRVAGRISLRELYLHIDTPHDGTYYGANCIIDEPPTDPNVGVLAFDTGQSGDERTQAKEYIESYAVRGPRSNMHPIGTQLAGQMQIAAYTEVGSPLPEVGEVYFLYVETGDFIGRQQSVKVSSVTSSQVTFYYNITSFTATQILFGITQALAYDFPGSDPTPTKGGDTWIRISQVSDSARYYGITTVPSEATTGSLELNLESIWGQLLPGTVAEIPVVDSKLSLSSHQVNAGSHTIDVSENSQSFAESINLNNRGLIYIHTMLPIPSVGSAIVSYRSQGKWYNLIDDGVGALRGADTSYGVGSINYTTGTGQITLGSLPDIGSSIIWQWGSSVHYVLRTEASISPIETLIEIGEPIVAVSLTITYMLNDVQTVATTDAAGFITGTGLGGHVVASTGDVYLFWSSTPDFGSSFELAYNAVVIVSEFIDGGWAGEEGPISFTLGQSPIVPGSLRLEYATTSLTHGGFTLDYTTSTGSGGYGLSARESTVTQLTTRTNQNTVFMNDSADGYIGIAGTVNYATGAVYLDPTPYFAPDIYYDGEWYPDTDSKLKLTNDYIKASYILDTAVPAVRTITLPIPDFTITFGNELIGDKLVPFSLRFTWNNQTYRDYGNGTIYRHASPWTTQTTDVHYAGTVDYTTRKVTLTDYVGGPGAIAVLSCLTRLGDWTANYFYARAPGSPLRPGSLYIQATKTNGTLLSAIADATGVIETTEMHGVVDQEMGIISINFGKYVLDSSLTADEKTLPWYNPANILGNGTIWYPTDVYPDTVRINAVVLSYLPLDPEELGLDPVRLPSNGKVPIIRSGYRLTLHHADTVNVGTPVAGSTASCGRTRVARVRLLDSSGRRIPDDRFYPGEYVLYSTLSTQDKALFQWWQINQDGYVWWPSSQDLDAGIVQFADPLDLTGYTTPLTLEHTIEDSFLCTSVDISGYITINRALTHDFPADSYLSSQMFWGDTFARYANLFSQATWTGVWSQTQIGDSTTGQYNDVIYPLVVTNSGAIEEEWRITFTSTTDFVVVGQRYGQIAIGSIATDLSPINPATSTPYFLMRYQGWGAGWAVGNTIRFYTVGPRAFWLARTVSPGPATGDIDSIRVALRGDSTPL